VITLDSSAILAFVNHSDRWHAQVRDTLLDDEGPYIIPVSILSEMCYMIESKLTQDALISFLSDIDMGGYMLDCGEQDFPRIYRLVSKYADFPPGFADAAVIACAERNGGRVLTLDMRHFGVVAREGTLILAPGWGNQ